MTHANAAEAAYQIGRALQIAGRDAEAVPLFEAAVRLSPTYSEPHNCLGIAAQARGDLNAAIDHYRMALDLRGDHPEAWCNLGTALEQAGRHLEGEWALAHALQLSPNLAPAWNNRASALRELGRFKECYAAYQRVRELAPELSDSLSGEIFASDADPDATVADRLAHKRRWYLAHRKPAFTTWANNRAPERPLKVGYVSADFRTHSAAFAFAPLVLGHDRRMFHVTLYSDTPTEDPMTPLFQRCGVWHDIRNTDDAALAAQIRADQIDILVDLGGHTGKNRLGMFTMKPAPVAVHHIGHLAGTGIPEIDWIFLDPIIGRDRAEYVERVWRLPCAFAYRPSDGCPEVNVLPALANGCVTFGYLGRWSKVNDTVLEVWRKILDAVPGSRLLIKDKRFACETERAAIGKVLGADRLLFMSLSGHIQHLQAHHLVDIGLDPFPQNGGVSTCEALWMGVPVVCMLGDRGGGRVAASIMATAGLGSLVSQTIDEYRTKAVWLATAGLGSLAGVRADLRSRMRDTTLVNQAAHVAEVEAAYRAMWREWLTSLPPSPVSTS